MKYVYLLLLAVMSGSSSLAQNELTSAEAKNLYKTVSKQRVSVHDPSVVYEPSTQRYYIFGSHKAGAWTTDLRNWTWAAPSWTPNTNENAFKTPEVKTVKKGGVEVDMPQFNAVDWSGRTDANYSVNGNMWAPDVIWNEKLQKWCMYLSINGDAWHSSIILLTSNSIQGPYKYQAPVVISGFDSGSHSYKDTDLELALGTLSSLPARYTGAWASTRAPGWPNNIDPCVFYDEEGKLWIAYGSWSGGIWMLELDEETGLRDYDVTYSVGTNSDPYFGKRIAGGYYSSGEGPYIEYIGGYYYLFMSYGGLDQKGGYEMRVFRSEKPDGPYVDPGKRSAVYSSYTLNFGPKAGPRGAKLLGPYSHWGYMPQGERAQGHNSIIAAPDGRTYLVYHTRFCNDAKKDDEGHQVRVHQVFQNKSGWLVASPFEYNGGEVTDAMIASTQMFSAEELAGTYSVLIHKFANDHAALEQVEPVEVTLEADGTITGDLKGTWTMEEGTSYVDLVMGGQKFESVAFEEIMDERNMHATAITGLSMTGIGMWAYKLHPKYELALQLNTQKVPVTANQNFNRDADLYAMAADKPNITQKWSSSNPDIISEYGKYNPNGLTEDTQVTLTARLETPGWFWQQDYTVKALSEANSLPQADWQTGMMAHYGFDNDDLANSMDNSQKAELKHAGTTANPTLEEGGPLRMGNAVHLAFGANGKESYVSMPNPLKGEEMAEGATLSMWVKRTDNNVWDALFGFTNGNARLYMTGNTYLGFNNGTGSWFDINHPEKKTATNIGVGRWHLLTVVIQRMAAASMGGVTIYVDGTSTKNDTYNGELNGTAATNRGAFDYNLIVDHISACNELCLGKGSFWGSPDVMIDDVIAFNRPLSLTEVMALRQMSNRVFDFSNMSAQGIETLTTENMKAGDGAVYDLQGRRVKASAQKKGLYIVNGKKLFIK